MLVMMSCVAGAQIASAQTESKIQQFRLVYSDRSAVSPVNLPRACCNFHQCLTHQTSSSRLMRSYGEGLPFVVLHASPHYAVHDGNERLENLTRW